MIRWPFLPLLLLLSLNAAAQPLRVMTYNALSFGSNEDGSRVAALKTVVDSLAPDILCVQEIEGPDGFFAFNDNISGPRGLAAGGFTDNDAIYFKASRLEYIDSRVISTVPETHVYILHVRGTNDTVDIVNVRLREGSTSADRDARSAACSAIRDDLSHLPSHRHHIILGTFGIRNAQEPGFLALTAAAMPGSSYDPAGSVAWSTDNASALLHTSSTRTTSLDDGGSTEGMTVRSDMILLSVPLNARYVAGSYRAVGQDGAHFGRSLIDGANGVVSAKLAGALHTASDHLPVVVELEFGSSGVERGDESRAVNLTTLQRTAQLVGQR